MLSPYSKELLQELKLEYNGDSKLVPNLLSQKNYVVTHKVLKLYQSLGMRIEKIH